jgi:hypothetical protein
MAEAFNSLFKAELVRNLGPWKNIDDLEVAVAEYIDWFNFRRLHGEIGLVPPVEYEQSHRSNALPEQPAQRQFAVSTEPGTWQVPRRISLRTVVHSPTATLCTGKADRYNCAPHRCAPIDPDNYNPENCRDPQGRSRPRCARAAPASPSRVSPAGPVARC